MYDLRRFGLREMILSSRGLRLLGAGCESFEEAAGQVVEFFFQSFRDMNGGSVGGTPDLNCALVRCFKTHRFGELPPNLREVVSGTMAGATPEAAMMCLTLMASRGAEPAWNTRYGSVGHRAIPLATAAMIERAPMIARLIEQVGLQPRDVLRASDEGTERAALDVFHVENAEGSPFVPAQEFVQQYKIRSVLGFGGMLPRGDLFFVLLFSRVPVTPETAALFRTLAFSAKLVFLNHANGQVFAE